MTPKIADINWLLSSLSQSTAALIAIVGGLLVSRYVALHAEQAAAQRRVADYERRLDAAHTEEADATRALEEHNVDDLIEDTALYEAIMNDEDGTLTVDDVFDIADADPSDYDREVVANRLEYLKNEFYAAVTAMYDVVPDSTEHDDWLQFRRTHTFNIGHKDVWEWIYDAIVAEKKRKARETQRKAAEKAAKKQPFGTLQALTSSRLSLPAVTVPKIRSMASQHEVARVTEMRARKRDAQARVAALTQEHQLATEIYEAARQPEGFILALQVLSFLAVVGLVLPVTVMGFGPERIDTWARIGLISAFCLGLGCLLRFLFVYASYLRQGGRQTLPKSISGLVSLRSN